MIDSLLTNQSLDFCSSGRFNLSCFDSNLDSSSVTPIRWQSSTPDTATATAVILLLFVTLGIPCNMFVIATILYKKLYHEPLHIIMLNLVINDIIMCLTYMPLNIVSGFAGEFIFGASDVVRCHVCNIGILNNIFLQVTLHLLAFMSIDRFIYFQFPLRYSRLVTTKTTTAAMIFTWVFSVLISLPPLFKFGEVRFTHSICMCFVYFLDKTDLTYNIFYEVFIIVEAFLFPFPVLLVTNVGVLILVCKHINKTYNIRGSSGSKSSQSTDYSDATVRHKSLKLKKKFKLVQVYGATLIFHIISWLPALINTALIFTFCKKPFVIHHGYFVVNYTFLMLGVVMHPFLQACLIPEIKNVLTQCSCKTRNSRDNLNIPIQGSRMSLLRTLSTKLSIGTVDSRDGNTTTSCCAGLCKTSHKITSTSTAQNKNVPPSLVINGAFSSTSQPSSCSASPVLGHSGTSPLLGRGNMPLPSPLLQVTPSANSLSVHTLPCIKIESEDQL